MRPAPLALLGTSTLSLVTLLVAACSGGSSQPPPSSGGGGPRASSSAADPGPSAAAPASANAPADPVQACVAKPAVEAKCEGIGVMQNGGALGDAGSARTQSVCDLVKSHRDAFRCCFDLWAKDHPGVSVKVSLALDLAHDGKLRGAELDKAKSTLSDPAFEKCAAAVAGALTYPESPTGKPTKYTHAFDFKAK